MQGLQDQQESTGTTFPVGKHAFGGGLASHGILVASRAFSLAWLPIFLCVPVLFWILADPGLSSWHWLGKHIC